MGYHLCLVVHQKHCKYGRDEVVCVVGRMGPDMGYHLCLVVHQKHGKHGRDGWFEW